MNPVPFRHCSPFAGAALLLFSAASPAQTIPVETLNQAPAVDGNSADWPGVAPHRIALHKSNPDGATNVAEVALRVGTHADRIYVHLEWPDSTQDLVHKPWTWDDQKNKYVKGPQREDRLAMHFSHDPAYTTDWRSGKTFSADTWHWKASRSNPLGLAHDKSLRISTDKLLRAHKMPLPDGSAIYISRPSDSGDKLYKTTRYRRFVEPLMPKYLLNAEAAGSVADVKAEGIWKDGVWHLEMSRKLNTGNADDVALPGASGQVSVGLAIFDHSENDDHAISKTLTLSFSANGSKPE